MQTMRLLLIGLAVLVSGGARAAEAPLTFRQLHVDADVAGDGRAVVTVHFEILADNDGAAKNLAQQWLSFVDGLERVELVEAYTLKADGRHVPLADGAVRTQLSPGSPSLPQFDDSKRVIAVFPDVQAGDAVVLTWRKTVDRPFFPGHYTHSAIFSRLYPWRDARVRITAPIDRPLQTEAFGPTMQVSEADGKRTYTWTYSAPAVTDDNAVLAALDRMPRLFASTFASWSAFGDAWAGLIQPKLAPSPRIQALADEITQGIEDKRAQTEAIYAWVSRHIRWVALYVGDGSFVPHAADSVLANGYGDCKDQVVLMLALLRAKGIVAEPALINAGASYKLSGPATLSAFNHVITYVPQFDLYADTTARGAPFGTLPAGLYGKPVLHVRLAGSELGRTPVLPAGVAVSRTRTEARLEANGQITGTTMSEATGPFATALRGTAERVQAEGMERGAADQLRALGESGTGELDFGKLDRVGTDYRASGKFTLNPQPDLLTGEEFRLPAGLGLLPHPGDRLLGPLALRNLPTSEPTPCYAGEQREEVSLALPPGLRPERLPRDRKVETEAFSYRSHWSFADGAIKVERELVSRIAQPLCEGTLREAAARTLNLIRRDEEARVSLEADE